jgi:hypothetical protein
MVMDTIQTVQKDDGGEVVRQIAGLISKALKGSSKSATLDDLVRAGCWYVVLDDKAQQIVFDMRALYLGFLEAGLQPRKGNIGNTAQWFLDWLRPRVGEILLTSALGQRTDMDAAGRLLEAGFAPTPSISVNELLGPAGGYAQQTVKRSTFDARHLFAAMIDRHAITEITARLFSITLSPEDIEDLKRDLVDHIMRSPQRGETRQAWFQVLNLKDDAPPPPSTSPPPPPPPSSTPPPSTSPPPPPPPEERISPFNGDTPSAPDDDVLDTEQDIEALAQLVCLDGAAPLAVAIFGDWGSGKSTFMAQLEARVRTLALEEAALKRPTEDEAGVARFVQPIVQIRFNAWHFADANLWASLTAEFFDQLRAGGYDRTGQARHAELVEKVNLHVHALSNAVSANREAVTQGAKDLLAAQVARDKAAKVARDAPGHTLAQSSIDLLSQTFVEQKSRLSALGLGAAAGRSGEGAGLVVGVIKDLSSTFGYARAVWGVLGKTRKRGWALVCLAAILLAALGVVMWTNQAGVPATVATVVGVIGIAVTVAKAVGPALGIVHDVAKRSAAVAGEIDAANEGAVSELLVKEVKLKKALAEARALEEAELASAKALARYIDPAGASNPPRLLRYVLEDDPDTKALEKDIGLIGRTRRLFQAVDDIARDMRRLRREPGYAERKDADLETPERIVIYIDDLDRCSEAKVYDVLQAIHLLLAFDLFVVVVGVDVGWVQGALARQFEDDQDLNQEQRRERAVAYLEKIFQVPFWLRPLSQGATGTFGRFVRSLAGTSVEDDAEARKAAEVAEAARQAALAKPAEEEAKKGVEKVAEEASTETPVGADKAATSAIEAATESVAEIRRTLQLTKAEIDFLASPEIAALAAAAPRGVKRLVNIYRLARTRRGQEDPVAVLGGPNRSAEHTLIALMAAVETGRTYQVAERFYDLLKTGQGKSVDDFLTPFLRTSELGPAPSLAERVWMAEVRLLLDGCRAAAKLRGGASLPADDLLAAARLVRRYSFNRYR